MDDKFKNINKKATNNNINIKEILNNSFISNKNLSSLDAQLWATIRKTVLNPVNTIIVDMDFSLSQQIKRNLKNGNI